MAKKFMEFLEAAAIIVLTAVLVVGVINYVKTTEHNDETPVVEGAEILSLTIVDISGMEDSYTISFEKGMTWREWINSEYNDLGFELQEDGTLVANMQKVKSYLEILGPGFGFRDSSSHGIRLAWESSVVPLEELVIPE